MFGQQRHSAKRFAARGARILLHVAVRLEVRPQVTPVGERAVAMLTAERFLPCVSSDVPLEKPGPGERFPAKMALAGQRVRSNVHFQRAQAHVHLLAVLARERLLRLALGGRAMKLLVLRQPGIRGVRFAAVRALVSRGRRRRRGRGRGRIRRHGRGRAARHPGFLDFRMDDRATRRRAPSR